MEKVKVFFKKSRKFLKEVWQEVDPKRGKVSWPDKDSVITSTIIVGVFVAICSIYIAVLDWLFLKLVNFISSIRW